MAFGIFLPKSAYRRMNQAGLLGAGRIRNIDREKGDGFWNFH